MKHRRMLAILVHIRWAEILVHIRWDKDIFTHKQEKKELSAYYWKLFTSGTSWQNSCASANRGGNRSFDL